ncbi:MAG: amidase [Desulfobacterales bacterium]|nr:amidase [Desulfobacterales bacterium]
MVRNYPNKSIIYGSMTVLAKLIQKRELSCYEVVLAHLEHIEKVNPKINAVFQIDADKALKEARRSDKALSKKTIYGPLHGVPVTIKDSLDTKRIISTWGTKGRQNFIPKKDASVVARLRRAGAIILGKTNTSEITLGGEMNNLVYGPSHNPYDLSKSPSSSSGGAAALLASGGSSLDLGTDTGGSIRCPAHVCGITGLKPTTGRTPRTGNAIPYLPGAIDCLTSVGPMARYVEDLITALPIICGPDGKDPAVIPMSLGNPENVRLENLKIAFYTNGGLHPPTIEISDAIRKTALKLADGVKIIKEDSPACLSMAEWLYPWLKFEDNGRWISQRLKTAKTTEPGPHMVRLLKEAESFKPPDDSKVSTVLDTFCKDMLQFLENYDVILCPPDVFPALPNGGPPQGYDYLMWSHLSAYNLTGWPAGVVRAGQTPGGLPIGIQVVGRPFCEHIVLSVMKVIESVCGGYSPPNIS